MYGELVKAGISLVGLALLVYTALKAKRIIRNQDSRNVSTDMKTENRVNREKCLVCLEDLHSSTRITLPCKHEFHRKCIFDVFDVEDTNLRYCPSCLLKVSEDFISNSRDSAYDCEMAVRFLHFAVKHSQNKTDSFMLLTQPSEFKLKSY